MRVDTRHPARGKRPVTPRRLHQHVGEIAAGQVPALEQEGDAVGPGQLAPGLDHRRLGRRFLPEQHLHFVEIRRDYHRERQELPADRRECLRPQEDGPAGCNHHRIDDGRDAPVGPQEFRHGGNNLGGVQHAGLERADPEIPVHLPHLLDHERCRHGLDRGDSAGILGGQAGEGRRTEHAMGGESQQVGLDAGPASAVGSGDGEDDGSIGGVHEGRGHG